MLLIQLVTALDASSTRSSAYFRTIILVPLTHTPILSIACMCATISLIHMENNDGDKHSPCRRPISNGKASINPSGVLIYS